jgi:Tfp pilus assembly protein PilN
MITQFTINLNKGEDLAEREARWRKRREIITLSVLVVLVLVFALINVQQYTTAENILLVKEQTIKDIDRRLDSLKKTGKNISKQDVLALAKLEKERVLWIKKFLSLGELLPNEMAVTYLEYKNQMLLLRFISTISKEEKEFDRVKEIIDKLRGSNLFFRDFSEMRLKEQHQTDVEGQTILSFSVLSKIDKGATTRRGSRGRRGSASANLSAG